MKYVDTRDGEVLNRNEVVERIQEKAKCDHSDISDGFREFLYAEKTINDIYFIYRGYSPDLLRDEYEAWLWKHLDKVHVIAYYPITSEALNLLEQAIALGPSDYDASFLVEGARKNDTEYLKGWIKRHEM
jgi:hypothetical protein